MPTAAQKLATKTGERQKMVNLEIYFNVSDSIKTNDRHIKSKLTLLAGGRKLIEPMAFKISSVKQDYSTLKTNKEIKKS